jgi:hypothetical protein
MINSKLFRAPAQLCHPTVSLAGSSNCLIIAAFPYIIHLWTQGPTISAGTSPAACLTNKCSYSPSAHTTWVIWMGMKYRLGSQRAALALLIFHKHCHLITLTIVADEYI